MQSARIGGFHGNSQCTRSVLHNFISPQSVVLYETDPWAPDYGSREHSKASQQLRCYRRSYKKNFVQHLQRFRSCRLALPWSVEPKHGGMGIWGYIPPPPRTSIPPAKTGWGVWQFFSRSKKLFGETGQNFWEFGGVHPPNRRSLPPPPSPTEKTCPCLVEPIRLKIVAQTRDFS
jgi:hypothetical protein